MPRRTFLSAPERAALLAIPLDETELIRRYTFSEQDLSVIRQHRGGHNRLGIAVQLCYLRYPGHSLPTEGMPPAELLSMVSRQLGLDSGIWPQYARRQETRREHLLELHALLGLEPFGLRHFRQFVQYLTEWALQTDRGIVLATALVEAIRQQRILIPSLDVIERICAQALTRGTRRVHQALTLPLDSIQQARLA